MLLGVKWLLLVIIYQIIDDLFNSNMKLQKSGPSLENEKAVRLALGKT